MFKHVLKIIKNTIPQNLWILFEMIVVITCSWYAIDYLYTIYVNHSKPLGFDYENVYKLTIGALSPDSKYYNPDSIHIGNVDSDFYIFKEKVLNHPAVEDICYTAHHYHYEGTNMEGIVCNNDVCKNVWLRYVTPSYFNVFRVKSDIGEDPIKLVEKMSKNNGVIITGDLANYLFGNNTTEVSYIQRKIDGSLISIPVLAVCQSQKYQDYRSYDEACYFPYRDNLFLESMPYIGFYMRVKPSYDHSNFIKDFRNEMVETVKIGNLYLEDIREVSSIREEYLKDDRNELYVYISVIVFLIANIFLAVLGTFWYRTRKRLSELALRMALGSSLWEIRRLLIYEGLALFLIAFLPSLIIWINLALSEILSTSLIEISFLRFFLVTFITIILLVCIILLGIELALKQIDRINPAQILRQE